VKLRFLTIFQNIWGKTKQALELTDDAVDKLFTGPNAGDKHDLPLISLQQFGDYADPRSGSLKTDRNVRSSFGAIGDYDGEVLAPEEIVEKLNRAQIEAKVKTTASHTSDKPRCHILCWYSEPRAADRDFHRRMLARLNGALGGGVLNAESLPLSQGFFIGAVIGGHPVEVLGSEGFPIDTLDELDHIASDQFINKSKTSTANGSNNSRADKEALLDQIRSGAHWHQPTLSLAGILAFEGVPLLDARKLLEDAFDQAEPDNSDPRQRKAHRKWQSKRDAVPQRLLEIYGKQWQKEQAKLEDAEEQLDELDERSGFRSQGEPDNSGILDVDSAADDSPGDRTTQAQQHWGGAPSFRDPWNEPEPAAWPRNVLPSFVNDMVFVTSEATGCDPSAQALATLAAVSGAAPKSSKLAPYGANEIWRAPPGLWIMIVAPSGFRKTALDTPFSALQAKHDQIWQQFADRLAEWESLSQAEQKKARKPREPHAFIVVDSSPERLQITLAQTNRGTLLKRDELAAFFGFGRYNQDKGAAERAFYLESYEGNPYTVMRIGRDSIHIKVNGLTIYGCIQPTRLQQFKGLEDDGLLQRFVIYCARPATPAQRRGQIPGKTEFDAKIEKLALMGGSLYHTDPEGADLIHRLEADAIEYATLADFGPGFQGFCGKLHGTCVRFALNLHLLECDDPTIATVRADTIARADRITREFVLPHAADFYRMLSPDRVERTRAIAGWLLTESPALLRASDFARHVYACRNLSLAELNQALDPLVGGGWLAPKLPFPQNRNWRLDLRVRTTLAHRLGIAGAQREAARQLAERILTPPSREEVK
jgi:hypothetical protein